MDTGTAGKTENCQIGVFLAYTSPASHALIDRELYLPAVWADPDHCVAAGIPEHQEFSTKYQLAQRMIERARAAHTPFSWITADEVYGQAEPLRAYLEREKIGYVMAVRAPKRSPSARIDRPDGRTVADPSVDDEHRQSVLALSDNGSQMPSGSTPGIHGLARDRGAFRATRYTDRPGVDRDVLRFVEGGIPAPAQDHRTRRPARRA
jgi:hypothetical protein